MLPIFRNCNSHGESPESLIDPLIRYSPLRSDYRLFVVFLALLLASGGLRAEVADFSLPDLEGEQRRLSEFRGKWVVVNYWATWCPPCREEMPELEVFHAGHEQSDAVVLGVNMERATTKQLRQFVDEQFLSFPILRDRPRSRTELGAIPGLPTTYLVNPQGVPVARQVGPVTAERLERFIENYR
jgi:peroxiredoxin